MVAPHLFGAEELLEPVLFPSCFTTNDEQKLCQKIDLKKCHIHSVLA